MPAKLEFVERWSYLKISSEFSLQLQSIMSNFIRAQIFLLRFSPIQCLPISLASSAKKKGAQGKKKTG